MCGGVSEDVATGSCTDRTLLIQQEVIYSGISSAYVHRPLKVHNSRPRVDRYVLADDVELNRSQTQRATHMRNLASHLCHSARGVAGISTEQQHNSSTAETERVSIMDDVVKWTAEAHAIVSTYMSMADDSDKPATLAKMQDSE